jgi:hypothetical protein
MRQAVADSNSDTSLASRVRARRWARLIERFPEWETMRVLDLGGTVEAWRVPTSRPQHVTVINPEGASASSPVGDNEPWMTLVQADACELPPDFAADGFDLVYSNSVIEHLGGHARRVRFAEVVRSLAPHYWVQTPNRYFPIEPHFLFPGFQFLPVRARGFLSGHWRLGWYSRPGEDLTSRLESVLEIELLSATELAHYFPDGTILRERYLGATKSLIAVR